MTDAWSAFPVVKPASYPAKSDFSALADKTFGRGQWSLNSGHRTPEHNAKVGGVTGSNHMKGDDADPGAYDISVKGMTPRQAQARLTAAGWGGSYFPENDHVHTNAPDMSGWDAFPKAAAAPAAGPKVSQSGTPGVFADSRKPGVAESNDLGSNIAARFHEGAEVTRGLVNHAAGHPLDYLDPRRMLKQIGAATDEITSPITGAVDTGVAALQKAMAGSQQERDYAKVDPSNRKMGDIAEMVLPGPKFGEAARGAKAMAEGVEGAWDASRAVSASDRAASVAKVALTGREKAQHEARVAMLKDAGVKDLTPGQIAGGDARAKEAAKASSGLARRAYMGQAKKANDSFQRGTFNHALEDIRGKVSGDFPVGHTGVDKVATRIQAFYDTVLPKVRLTVDEELENGLAENREAARALRNPEAIRLYKALDRSVRKQLKSGETIDGKTFKQIESDMRLDIKALQADPKNWREVRLLRDYRDVLRAGAERSSPPGVAAQLKKVNASYAKLAKIEDAASIHAGGGGEFDTKDLLEAVKRDDDSPHNQRFAKGDAHMQRWADTAHKVMGQGAEGAVHHDPLHVHPSPSGVVSSTVRAVGRAVANPLAKRNMERAAADARRKEVLDKLPKRKTKGAGTMAGVAGYEAGRAGDDQ